MRWLMPTIGERLRAAREAKGLQVEDAHRQTKIHIRILQAMEEDRAPEVLDPAYAKGFLKKYAAFLNLDPAPLLAEYRQSERVSAPLASSANGAGGPGEEAAAGIPRWLVVASITVIALIGLIFLILLSKDLSRPVSAPTPAPAAKPVAPSKPTPPPTPKLLVPRSQPLKLSVRAAQDCWMQVKVDEKVLFQNVLAKGHEETWTSNEMVELWVGNAAALTLTLNGHSLEPLGQGVIKGIRITRAGLQSPKKSHAAP